MAQATTPISIATSTGSVDVDTVWIGANLAVHRFYTVDPTVVAAPGHWAVTAHKLGLAACGHFRGSKAAAVRLAKLWDNAFEGVTAENARQWRYRQTWAADCAAAQLGAIGDLAGPVLPDHPTSGDVAAAISRAIGGNFEPATGDEAAEQYPAHETAPHRSLRTGADGDEISWGGRWYPVPTIGEVEAWICDSVCETPNGSTVEPDHPESWLSILGLI